MQLKLNYNVPIAELGLVDNDFLIQGVAINATITGNNHKFLAEELRSSAGTLNGVPLLVDHKNEVSAIKGRVKVGEYDEINSRINFKAKIIDNEIKQMVKEGLINSVSVGAEVREIEEQDGTLIPRGITFKELSLVAVPADAGATFTTALQEAYKLVSSNKKEEKLITDSTEIMKSQSSKDELQSMKGGNKMSEKEIIETKEQKPEVNQNKELLEMISKLSSKIDSMETKMTEKKEIKAETKVEKKELEEDSDIIEAGKYKIVQGFGALRGNSFTLVR